MTSTATPPIIYSAPRVTELLGLPCDCRDPVPTAEPGEIVVYYGGWTLPQLRDSPCGKKSMWQDQTWYDKYQWKGEAGYYALLLPVPGSNSMTWGEQLAHVKSLPDAWQPAPVCLTALALLLRLAETGIDLLKDDWCCSAESLPYGFHADLAVFGGRVYVDIRWDDNRNFYIWLAASRKC